MVYNHFLSFENIQTSFDFFAKRDLSASKFGNYVGEACQELQVKSTSGQEESFHFQSILQFFFFFLFGCAKSINFTVKILIYESNSIDNDTLYNFF